MRSIGELESAGLATRFCDFLLTVGIDAMHEPATDDPLGSQDIWVRDEERLDDARRELDRFLANPNDERYSKVGPQAEQLRAEQHAENQRRLKLQKRVQYQGARDIGGQGAGVSLSAIPVTVATVALCVLATFATEMGSPQVDADEEGRGTPTFAYRLFDTLSFVSREDYLDSNRDPLASIRKGQVWRLLTPMFVHIGVIHLLFNMLWMFRLGSAIERIQSAVFLLLLMLFCELVAGLLQALMPEALGGSPFGFGASGAVYGLFGYLWMRTKFDSSYPYQLTQGTIMLMIAWLFLCMTGIVGPIGNGAHVGGLLAGMAAGFVTWKLTQR